MQSPSPTTEAEVSTNADARLQSCLADRSWQEIAALARLEADGDADEQTTTELSTDRLRW